MRNAPHVSAIAVASGFRHPDVPPLLAVVAVVAICSLLICLAVSLPGRSPEGVILGASTTIVAMIVVARPSLAPALYGIVALVAGGRAYTWSRSSPPGNPRWGFLRLGGFWLAVPVAAFAAISTRTGPHLAYVAETIAVFALIMTAARRRGRDLSVGYAAGLLLALAALVASAYGEQLGAGRLLAYPAELTGLLALVCAGRIGLDRSFARWQRIAALGVGTVTLVTVGSPPAFIAAAVASATYLVFRLRVARVPRAVPEQTAVAFARASTPLLAVLGLWFISAASARPPPRHASVLSLGAPQDASAVSLAAFERTGVIGKIFGFAEPGPLGALSGAGLLGLIALAIGAALVLWRVTGPGLPIWLPVVALAGLVGVLAAGTRTMGPSPAWIMAFAAELWVFCHGLRPDRDVTPSPELADDNYET
jgi:hypothetical protein